MHLKYLAIYLIGVLWLIYSARFYIFADDVTELRGVEKIEDKVLAVNECDYRSKYNRSNLRVQVSNNRIIDVIFRYDMCDTKDRYIGKKITAYVIGHDEYQVDIGSERAQTFERSKFGDNAAVFMFTGFPVVWALYFTILSHRKKVIDLS